MLTYINAGRRDYFQNPIPTYQRGTWEFQAVLAGSIAAVLPDKPEVSFLEKTIWVFPPGSRHGWVGQENSPADILVFHFTHISKELAVLVQGQGYLRLSLNQDDTVLLQGFYEQLHREYSNMGPLYDLKSRICSDRLALLFCSRFEHRLNSQEQTERNVVENAIALFSSEMEYGISLREISERMGFSVPHIRRLFHNVMGTPPRSCFEEIRMKRARELCRFTGYRMGEIARACGYAEQSSFTKAYVRFWHVPPSRIRSK